MSAVASSPGLAFKVAGLPVSVRLSFFAVVGLIGIGPTFDAGRLVIWVAVAFVSVMIHELGHATAARRLGAEPSIELYGMGGLTRWSGIDPSRRQMIGITLAGPGAGFVVGAIVGAGVLILDTTGAGDVRYFVLTVLWINIGWGAVNLLPVLPLDGGQVVAELLPGDRPTRFRRAAILSIGVAAISGVWLMLLGFPFALVLCGWALLTNVAALREEKTRRGQVELAERATRVVHLVAEQTPSAGDEAVAVANGLAPANGVFRSALIETAAAVGDAETARRMLDSPGEPLPPAAYALTFVVESGGADGVNELVEIFRREPTTLHARWLTVALFRAGRLAEVGQLTAGAPADAIETATAVAGMLSAGAPTGTRRAPPGPSSPPHRPPADR